MMADREYDFRRVKIDDLPLLLEWQARPHVCEWWVSDNPYDHKELADPRVSRWIVSMHKSPFAFMQDYTVHGWDDHHFAQLPKDRKSTRLNSSHVKRSRMPSSA